MQMELSERPRWASSPARSCSPTPFDTEHIKADYDAGVLTLPSLIAERAKPRKIFHRRRLRPKGDLRLTPAGPLRRRAPDLPTQPALRTPVGSPKKKGAAAR
ncbi:hypothetical protein GCM10018966_025590 [Streptomyces yanii]